MSNTAENPAGTVLITGAGRGLGRTLADLYAAAGWRVIRCMRQAVDGALPLDVADAGSIAALGERLAGQPIDIVINNAAIRGDTGGLSSLESDDFLEVMRVNALAPLLVARALHPNL
nr:SDR family NAD(P)-dependent oxidoreductase [uncultured Shinella sp.]